MALPYHQDAKSHMDITRVVLLTTVLCSDLSQAQFEQSRCHCVCPSLKSHTNSSTDRVLYSGSYSHDDCNCDIVVLPKIFNLVTDERVLLSYCAKCDCKYESRNLLVIQVGVLLTIILVVYLLLHLVCHTFFRFFRLKRIFGYHLQSEVITDDTVRISVISFILAFSSLLIYMSFLTCSHHCSSVRKGDGKYARHLDIDDEESDNMFGANGFFLRPTTTATTGAEFRQRNDVKAGKFSDDIVAEQTAVS